MNNQEIRWRQFFDNFEAVYQIFSHYSEKHLNTNLEKAGYIHYFEMVIEHANKVMKSYVEAKGKCVENPRNVIKEMAKLNIIFNERVWFKILNRRNLPFYIHNEALLNELIDDIKESYYNEVTLFYNKLKNKTHYEL